MIECQLGLWSCFHLLPKTVIFDKLIEPNKKKNQKKNSMSVMALHSDQRALIIFVHLMKIKACF